MTDDERRIAFAMYIGGFVEAVQHVDATIPVRVERRDEHGELVFRSREITADGKTRERSFAVSFCGIVFHDALAAGRADGSVHAVEWVKS